MRLMQLMQLMQWPCCTPGKPLWTVLACSVANVRFCRQAVEAVEAVKAAVGLPRSGEASVCFHIVLCACAPNACAAILPLGLKPLQRRGAVA